MSVKCMEDRSEAAKKYKPAQMRGTGLQLHSAHWCTLPFCPVKSTSDAWLQNCARSGRGRGRKREDSRACLRHMRLATVPPPVTPPPSKVRERHGAFIGITAADDEVKDEPSVSQTAAWQPCCWSESALAWRAHVSISHD